MLIIFFLSQLLLTNEKVRTMEYNGATVNTTYEVEANFYGEYKGRKSGYLLLNEDGTGVYAYDVFGFAPGSCKKQPIAIKWGFLIDENGAVVSSKRDYGLSYPILLESTGETSFQGCQKKVMLDFIMKYKNGQLGVSSSDDWVKE